MNKKLSEIEVTNLLKLIVSNDTVREVKLNTLSCEDLRANIDYLNSYLSKVLKVLQENKKIFKEKIENLLK